MNYKTLEDVNRVVEANKPNKVIDVFIESYLQGLEFGKWMKLMKSEWATAHPVDIDGDPILDGSGEETGLYEQTPNPDFVSFDVWMNETEEVVVGHRNVYDVDEATVIDTVPIVETVNIRRYKEVEVNIDEFKKPLRFAKLEKIFRVKANGLKKLAIDKPWMNDPEAINDQYRVYEEMYKNAKNGLYDEDTNGAIIFANETAKAKLSAITLLLNSVRHVLETKIEISDKDVDSLLTLAENIVIRKEDLSEDKINEIKEAFGV